MRVRSKQDKMKPEKRTGSDKMKQILILEDDEDLAKGMELALSDSDLSFVLCSTIKEARRQLDSQVKQSREFYICWSFTQSRF